MDWLGAMNRVTHVKYKGPFVNAMELLYFSLLGLNPFVYMVILCEVWSPPRGVTADDFARKLLVRIFFRVIHSLLYSLSCVITFSVLSFLSILFCPYLWLFANDAKAKS